MYNDPPSYFSYHNMKGGNHMHTSTDVLAFLKTVKPDILSNYVMSDIRDAYNIVAEQIIQNKLNLELSWNRYILMDVDIMYINDVLELYDKLRLFGINQIVGPINIHDSAIIIIYEYHYNDIVGNILSTAKMIHVIHQIGNKDYVQHVYVFRVD